MIDKQLDQREPEPQR